MSKLKKFIISIAVFLGIIIVIGFFLPSSVTVKRTITIKAPNENIYEYISHLKLFNKFSPWVKYDPKTQYIFTGVDGKVGSKMAWSSERKEVGKGTQTITALIPGKEVHIELDFGDEGIANSYFKLKMLADQKTQVTWGFDTQLGMNPMMRYMGLMLDHWVGPSYEEGLSNLKKLVESEYEPVDFSKLKVTILQVESKPIIYKKGQVKMDKKIMSATYRTNYHNLLSYLDLTNAQQSGDPMAITTLWDTQNKIWGYKIAIPYHGDLTLTNGAQLDPDKKVEEQPFFEIQKGNTYQGKALKVTHIGSYDGLKSKYAMIFAYMKAKKLTKAGDSWEVYVSDPETTPRAELQTDIFIPIK